MSKKTLAQSGKKRKDTLKGKAGEAAKGKATKTAKKLSLFDEADEPLDASQSKKKKGKSFSDDNASWLRLKEDDVSEKASHCLTADFAPQADDGSQVESSDQSGEEDEFLGMQEGDLDSLSEDMVG